MSSEGIDPGLDEARERLHLADWRRRMAELYAEVRLIAASDPAAAWSHWREVRDELYRAHPSSPVPPGSRASFAGRYFDYDPALRFDLPVLALEPPDMAALQPVAGPLAHLGPVPLPISTGQPISFERVGRLEIPFRSGRRTLVLFWLPEYASGFFLPFRDATNGAETYGGGRYLLDTSKGADLGSDPDRGTVIVDFNFAYQPSCAFDPRWSCPLSPPENRLDLPIRAGERLA